MGVKQTSIGASIRVNKKPDTNAGLVLYLLKSNLFTATVSLFVNVVGDFADTFLFI